MDELEGLTWEDDLGELEQARFEVAACECGAEARIIHRGRFLCSACCLKGLTQLHARRSPELAGAAAGR